MTGGTEVAVAVEKLRDNMPSLSGWQPPWPGSAGNGTVFSRASIWE